MNEEHRNLGEHHPPEHTGVHNTEHKPTHHTEHKPTHHTDHKEEETMTVNKVTVWQGIAGILGILLIISVFTAGFGIKSSEDTAPEAQAAQKRDAQPTQAAPTQPAPQAPSIDMKTLIDDDTIKGDKDAPVTIVEWSDFECPFCTRFYTQTLGQIDEQYIKTGKVKLIYRDFPLGFHANAQKAGEAAECAGEQEKFWEMHDKLFEEGVSGGVDSFKQFAKDLGLDAAKFDECLDSGAMADEVKKDMADGAAVGITGTPGFIINGQLVSGAQPFENFKQVIEAELAK